jgi:protein ImuB
MQPLLFILQRLLRQLGGYLRARDAGAQQMRLGFIMPFAPIEWLELTLLQPSRDPEHLLRLWREKLERHRLSAPAEGLELKVDHLLPLEQVSQDLLGAPNKTDLEFMQTLERLRNRLGARVIRQPVCAADHRPERSGRQRAFPARQHGDDGPAPLRPLWLLPRPRPLAQTGNGGPSLHGPLTLLNGPERIESGWWDGGDQRRDYYVARSPRRQRLWIYRDLGQPPRWFLHGFFS